MRNPIAVGYDKFNNRVTATMLPNGFLRLYCYGPGMSELLREPQSIDLVISGCITPGEAWDLRLS